MDESKAIVQMILAGERNAFKTLVEEYQRLVSSIVFRMIRNQLDREDICQEVFIKVYQNLGSFRFDSKLSTWIAQIAYNSCINYVRAHRNSTWAEIGLEDETVMSIPDNRFSPADYAESRDISFRLAEEIDRMPIIYGIVLCLFHLEEMSYGEISQIMKLPAGTVKSHLFRARKILKDRLTAKYEREEL